MHIGYGYASFIKESVQYRCAQPGPTESAQSILNSDWKETRLTTVSK